MRKSDKKNVKCRVKKKGQRICLYNHFGLKYLFGEKCLPLGHSVYILLIRRLCVTSLAISQMCTNETECALFHLLMLLQRNYLINLFSSIVEIIQRNASLDPIAHTHMSSKLVFMQ